MFLEECKYVVKEKKKSKFITDDIEIFLVILIKKILMKKIKYKEVLDFASSLLKYQKFVKLGAQKFHFLKYIKASFPFSDVDFFYFSGFGWKLQGSISGSTRKAFFWENIRIFLIFELKSSISGNIRNFFRSQYFLFFWGLGWEVR